MSKLKRIISIAVGLVVLIVLGYVIFTVVKL